MVLKRNLLGWRFEEYWFDAPGYLNSSADIVALRTHTNEVARFQCRIPETTLLIPLGRTDEEILGAFAARAKTSIKQAIKTVQVELATSDSDRKMFYDAYVPFAKTKGLLLPNPEEENDLEIFLAKNMDGELLQAAAFLPAPLVGIYRYRYGVYLKKSQSNTILLYTAIKRAKELGFAHFDLGGITPNAQPGSSDAGINFFKSQFGGVETASQLFLRGNGLTTRWMFSFLEKTGLAAHHHTIAAWAGRIARR